jgi:uncharacterized protein (TIGR02598 family)
MNPSIHNPSWRPRGAFSLVEVTLALAVVATGLVVMLGLLPQGLQYGRAASDNTIAATLAQNIFNTMRRQPFSSVTITDATPGATFSLGNSGSFTCLYDQGGQPTASSSDYYFQVVVSYDPQSTALSRVRAQVAWPYKQGGAAPISTNIFTTLITSFDNP